MRSVKIKTAGTEAFSRFEMIIALAVVAVIALLALGVMKIRSTVKLSGNASQCLNNLKEIGTAMNLYITDNEKRLPFAGIRLGPGMHYTWDDLLNSRLGGKFSEAELMSSDPRTDMPVLRCPSDTVALNTNIPSTSHRRTYALTYHDMMDANWPPSKDNQTGIGLVWDIGRKSSNPISTNRWQQPKTMDNPFDKFRQVTVNASMVLAPQETLMLSERPTRENAIGGINSCTIKNVSDHFTPKTKLDPAQYHENRFNYLFIDGHAENLDPIKTIGTKNASPAIASGMWTIDVKD